LPIERLRAPLAPSDAAQLAELHGRILPRSLVARLGRGYVERFHAFCAGSPDEAALVVRDAHGAIAGACVLGFSPADFGARLRAGTNVLSAAATHPDAWAALLRSALAPGPEPMGPEIVLLFAGEAARGRGLGSALVEASLREAASRGHARLSVLTEDDPGNRALAFYAKNGFADEGPVRLHGAPFRRLARACAHEGPSCAA
jgi:GNAT superfamily N-acetyltransferase